MTMRSGVRCATRLAAGLLAAGLVAGASGDAAGRPYRPGTPRSATAAGQRTPPAQEQPPESAALPVVGGLRFEGNRALSDGQLRAVVFTRGPDWRIWRRDPEFSEPTLLGDLERIESLYELHGFYEAEVGSALTWNRAGTVVAITIRVEEGPDVRLRRFELPRPVGLELDAEAWDELVAGLPLRPGEPFSAERYARAKELLLDRLAELGHPLARIEGGATVELDDHHAEVDWRVDSGPLVRFGEVRIRGLYRVDERTTRREVRIEPGARYSTSALQNTRRRLQQQGLYSWVTVQSRPGEATAAAPAEGVAEPALGGAAEPALGGAAETAPVGPLAPPESGAPPAEVVWPVEVRVTERSPHTVYAGVGYSSDESFRASAGWRHVDFLGDARKLRLGALYSGILSKLEAEFTQPYFFDRDLSLIARGAFRLEKEPAYEADRVLTSIGLSRPIDTHWRGRVNYEFSWQDVLRLTPDPLIVLELPEGVSRTATIELGVRRQSLDDLLDPREGTWLDFAVAPAFQEIGSNFDFVTFLVEGRAFVPTPFSGVAAARLRIGAEQPFRATSAAAIPVTSRFYAGGSSSHRGFQYHRMPPVGVADFNLGGTSVIEASLEWRFPIVGKLGGVAFVDAGLLDLQPWRYRLDRLFWAVGPGLRYDTVIGPLRFDYGFLVNPPAGYVSQHQWFISVGHSF